MRHDILQPALIALGASVLSGWTAPVTAAPSFPVQEQAAQAYDVVILGGKVINGSGNAWFYGDVAVTGDRIARITPAGGLSGAPATRSIDARGMIVAPGFIDIQSHSRESFLEGDGRVVSKITQGITTEIMGEGWTNAPENTRTRQGTGPNNPTDDEAPHDFSGPRGFDRWLRAMHERGVSPNIGSFVGATTVRVYGSGQRQGAATPAELDSMRAAVRHAMEDGAFGIATALIYPPGNFASTDELVELARVTAPYGGTYITHMRSEADRYLEAIAEAIEIGERAGVPVEIYHLKAAGRRNWNKARAAVALIDSARAAGLDVQANMYPYVAGGTGLAAVLPPWASADGQLLESLRDADRRRAIHDDVIADTGEWENLGMQATPEGIRVAGLDEPDTERWQGATLASVAEDMGVDWVDAAIELLLAEEGRVGAIFFMMNEENVEFQMRQPWMKFGTDAGGFDPETAEGLAHPRAYGTYPRILGEYVRERGVLTWEDAIRKMTSAVATRLHIQDRGLLVEGFYADLVVFDPDRVADRATFEEPHQLSVGIEHVLVNGVPVVTDGHPTGETPGRIVRGPGWTGAN